ncbi:MAG: polyprenyl synthetase family protein, partial [Chthonomonadales bacterium]
FELIGKNGSTVSSDRVVEATLMISRATGMQGMVGGQVVDMESEDQDISLETLKYIHANKTGALITASSIVGALLCGATDSQISALTSYGQSIGLAFQIADDILDIVGDQEKIGKPVGSDEGNNKATYPKFFGLDESRRMAHTEVGNAIAALSEFGESADPLRAIARFIVERDL